MKLQIQVLGPMVVMLLSFLFANSVHAQNDPIYINGPYSISSAGPSEQWYSNVELGPQAELYIESGVKVIFYGADFKMDPGAKIYGADNTWVTFVQGDGTGSILFQQPNPINSTTVQQTLDGGNGGNPANNAQNTFTSIELNNNLGVKLINTDARVGRNITFTNGHLYTDMRDMVLTFNGAISGADATKYVVTAVAAPTGGHLVKEFYTGAFLFPVGMADGDYTPVTVAPLPVNTIHVNVTDYASDAPLESRTDGMQRSWNIYANNATAAVIAAQHNTTTNQAQFNTGANFLTQYGALPNLSGDMNSTSAWQVNTLGASSATGGAGTETQSRSYSALATTSSANEAWFTKASDIINPLSVTLLSFNAKRSGLSDLLYWSTASEQNVKGYELQYSNDAINFNVLATLPATGNSSSTTQSYRYTHTPVAGSAWYRIRVLSDDGKYSYSNLVKTVANGGEADGIVVNSIYPVPFRDVIKLNLSSNVDELASVVLYNIEGKKLMQTDCKIAAGTFIYTLQNLGELPTGSYFLNIQTAQQTLSVKVNKE